MDREITSWATAVETDAAYDRARAMALDCGLAYTEVDGLLDLAPGTFRGLCVSAPLDHPAEGRVRVLADALDFAARLLGGRSHVAVWLRTPHPLMEGRPPVGFLTEHPEALRALRDALRGEWTGLAEKLEPGSQ